MQAIKKYVLIFFSLIVCAGLFETSLDARRGSGGGGRRSAAKSHASAGRQRVSRADTRHTKLASHRPRRGAGRDHAIGDRNLNLRDRDIDIDRSRDISVSGTAYGSAYDDYYGPRVGLGLGAGFTTAAIINAATDEEPEVIYVDADDQEGEDYEDYSDENYINTGYTPYGPGFRPEADPANLIGL